MCIFFLLGLLFCLVFFFLVLLFLLRIDLQPCDYYYCITTVLNCVHFGRTPFIKIPQIAGRDVDLYLLYRRVIALGGWQKVGKISTGNCPMFEFTSAAYMHTAFLSTTIWIFSKLPINISFFLCDDNNNLIMDAAKSIFVSIFSRPLVFKNGFCMCVSSGLFV